eukprot:g7792.t2
MLLPHHDPSAVLESVDVQRNAEVFASSPVEVIDTSSEVLCVLQGEVAAASPGDGPLGLGSDSATTCHIVAFRNPSSGRTCLSHLDSALEAAAATASMLRLMSRVGGGGGCGGVRGSDRRTPEELAEGGGGEEPLDLYVVGGYLGKSCAEELTSALFSALDESRRPFRVVLACMARLNSVPVPARDGWLPRQTGLAVDVATGRSYPVRFEGAGRGPAWEARSSRIFAGSRVEALTEIYEPRTDSVVVPPFPVYVDPRWLLQMLALPDRQLLTQTSTSPEAEDERFVEDIRAQFSYMVAQSGPDGRSWLRNVFGGGRGSQLVFPRAAAAAAAARGGEEAAVGAVG